MGLPVSGSRFVKLMRDPFSQGRRMGSPPSHFPHVSHVSLKVGKRTRTSSFYTNPHSISSRWLIPMSRTDWQRSERESATRQGETGCLPSQEEHLPSSFCTCHHNQQWGSVRSPLFSPPHALAFVKTYHDKTTIFMVSQREAGRQRQPDIKRLSYFGV